MKAKLCKDPTYTHLIYRYPSIADVAEKQAKRVKIQEWLSDVSLSEKHQELKRRRVPGSGEWFLSSAPFLNWFQKPLPTCLLCIGTRLPLQTPISDRVAGAGKSTLMLNPNSKPKC